MSFAFGSGGLFAVLICIAAGFFFIGRARAIKISAAKHQRGRMQSLPRHYGTLAALWVALPALIFLAAASMITPLLIDNRVTAAIPAHIKHISSPAQLELMLHRIKTSATVAANDDIAAAREVWKNAKQRAAKLQTLGAILLALGAGLYALQKMRAIQNARRKLERALQFLLAASAWMAVLVTAGIFLSVLVEALRFFQLVSPIEFLFGTQWSPQTAIRADQVGASGAFGALPVFAGTLLISAVALALAVPVGLMSAVYMSEYAGARLRNLAKPALEILAGIPTVVYGFLAAVSVAPLLRDAGARIGLDIASESALTAGLVMGVMIIPFVSSLSDDVIHAVPNSLRAGSLALGSTHSEMLRRVVLPAALPGLVGAVLLAASRAIGETMIVVMAAGLTANLTANPFEAVTTATVQIVTLLVGDQEFGSAKTLSAFALGLALFLITLMFNVVALRVVKKYRERY